MSAAVKTAASARAEWDAAMVRYQAAIVAREPYVDSVHTPEGIRAELSASYRCLLAMPAPDCEALRWKLNELLEDKGDCILADISRLLGDGGPAHDDPIAAYNRAFDAFNAGQLGEHAYYDTLYRIREYQPETQRDFIRKFIALWKEGLSRPKM
jgi:hypothetical protein